MFVSRSEEQSIRGHAVSPKWLGRISSKVRERLLATGFATSLIMCAADFYSTSEDSKRVRGILPEPFDFFNHAGNFGTSLAVGACATQFVISGSKAISDNPPRVNRLAIGCGIAVATAVNALSETKLGISIAPGLNPETVPDTIDAMYGVGAGAVAAVTIAAYNDELTQLSS